MPSTQVPTRARLTLPAAAPSAYAGLIELWRGIARALHTPGATLADRLLAGEDDPAEYLCASLLEGVDAAVAAAHAAKRDTVRPSMEVDAEPARRGLHYLSWHEEWLERAAALRAIEVPAPTEEVLRLRAAVLSALATQLAGPWKRVRVQQPA